MKFYSDVLNKVFDTEKECVSAEKKYIAEQEEKKNAEKKKSEERAAAAKRVEAAQKAMHEAQTAYRKELEDFCAMYGTYHYSTDSFDNIPHLFSTLFDLL